MRREGRWRILLAAGAVWASLLGAPPTEAQNADRQNPPGAPVLLGPDTLFSLYGTLGAFTPAERAAAATARLQRAARTLASDADSIVLVEGETHTDLVVGDNILMTVLDADAAAAGTSRSVLAAEYAATARAAIRTAASRITTRALAFGVLYTIFATLTLVVLLRLIGHLVPRAEGTVERWRASRIPALRIQRLEIVSADRIADFLLGAIRIVRLGLVILLLYVYVPMVLSFFPWTAPFAGKIVGYVVTPLAHGGQAFIGYLPSLFVIVVVVFVTRFVLKFIRLFFEAVGRRAVVLPGFYPEWSDPTYKIVRFMVLAFVLVVLFPYLPGSSSDAFRGVSLFLGALFTLGSSSAISNVVAGTVLTYTRAFQIGDRIGIGDTVGDVIEKSLLATRVRTIKNVDITVPNAQVLSSHIINYSTVGTTGGVILHTTVTIGYDAPWRRVHELLIAAAGSTENILASPAPFVLQTSLDDFYVSYQLNAYTDQPALMARTYSELHQRIQDAFHQGGVEIMSPHYRALRDGNAVAIPASDLPPGYQAPPFRVSTKDPPG